MTHARAAQQEQYRRTNVRKQQILVGYKRESMRANMKAQRGIIATLWLYAIAAVAVAAALYGAYEYVNHSWETSAGISRGKEIKQAEWQEANRQATADAENLRRDRERLAAQQSAKLASAESRARDADAKWRRARAEAARAKVPLVVSECIEQGGGVPAPEPGGGGLRLATSLRFTAQWLSEWDAAWSDQAGQPVFPDPGIPAAEAGKASPIGPDEVLANHQENASLCSEDRRRYGNLIDLLEKLRAR